MNGFGRTARAKLFLCVPFLVAACGSSGDPTTPATTAGTGGIPAGSGGSLPGSGGTRAGSAGLTGGVLGGGGAASGGGGSPAASGGVSTAGGSTPVGGGAGVTASGGAVTAGSAGAPGGGAGAPGGGAGGSGGAATDSARDVHFKDWPQGADPATVGNRLAEVFAGETPEDPKHYKVACAWYGSLAVSAILGNQMRVDALIAKYAPLKNSYSMLLAGMGHVDQNVFGIVPLEISLHTDDPSYLMEGLAIADHQRANISTQKRFAIDDMFMITALQVQAYRASKETKYLDTGASVMVEYLSRLQQTDGMFFHHEDFHHKWGRGNGWFAAGMAEIIRELPQTHANYAAIRAGYEKMMAGLLNYQIKDGAWSGLWKQIVDSTDTRNWPETSGSAMFTYALVSGVRAGWLDPTMYGPAARAGWLALVAKIDAQGKIQDISDWAYKPASHPESGTKYDSDEENYYFDRPKLTGDNHGQAPVLWSAAALAR